MWTMLSLENTTSNVAGGSGRGPGATLARPIRAVSPSRAISARALARTVSSTSIPVTYPAWWSRTRARAIPAGTAADIQHRCTAQIGIRDQPGYLRGAARREKSLAPERLKHRHCAAVIELALGVRVHPPVKRSRRSRLPVISSGAPSCPSSSSRACGPSSTSFCLSSCPSSPASRPGARPGRAWRRSSFWRQPFSSAGQLFLLAAALSSSALLFLFGRGLLLWRQLSSWVPTSSFWRPVSARPWQGQGRLSWRGPPRAAAGFGVGRRSRRFRRC